MTRIIMSSGLLAALTPSAHAGAWATTGQAVVGGSYDDNVRLTTTSALAGQQLLIDVSATLAYQDDATSLRVSPRFVTVRYDVDKSLNRNEPSLLMRVTRSNETGETTLSLSGVQDTTLTSELGSTGFSNVNKRHRVGALTIGRSMNAAERMTVGTQLYATASRYLDAEFTGLVDYNYGSALLNGGYNLGERSAFTLQASIGKLQVPDIAAYDKTNLDVTLGYRLQIAPLWRAELSFGPSQIRTQGKAEDGTVYSASINHGTALNTFNLTVNRSVTPNGLGLLGRKDQANLVFIHSLNERWTTEWVAAWIRNQNVLPSSGLTQPAVQYADLTGSVRWRMTPTLSLSISAGAARQRIHGAQSAATRRHAALNLSWNSLTRTVN